MVVPVTPNPFPKSIIMHSQINLNQFTGKPSNLEYLILTHHFDWLLFLHNFMFGIPNFGQFANHKIQDEGK